MLPKLIKGSTQSLSEFCRFCRNWQDDPIIHMEMQRTQNSREKKKKNLDKEEQIWRTNTFQYENLLQGSSNQDNLVLAYIWLDV